MLTFDKNQYAVKTLELGGQTITYRAWEGLCYCENPADGIQKLNLYTPEAYFAGEKIHGYDLHTAPIFMPNTVGGYMEGPAMEPGVDQFRGNLNTAFLALAHGYVVACAGIRGRNTGMASNEFFVGGDANARNKDGAEGEDHLVGRAPSLIVDMKAAIRYLRHFKDEIPGDTEKIITNGTSAGGALSAMTGATGNAPEYAPYLAAIGAADERDDIFAASCYCPIHNLENADLAYEWMFREETTWHRMNFERTPDGVKLTPVSGEMPEGRIAVSKVLAERFPAYLNSLGLVDENGEPLTLDEGGEGSFKEYLKKWVILSAEKEAATHWSKGKGMLMTPGSDVEEQEYLTLTDGKVTAFDWKGFIHAITRMKMAPAFDDLALLSPECEEFGDDQVFARHFSKTAAEYTEVEAEMADDAVIRLLNPTRFIRDEHAVKAPHWRIRHGAYDRDTALAIPVILQTMLKNAGYDVDFFLPWGLPHSGDYDIDELFAWIDRLAK